jgi:four helix bundle protein
MKKNIIEEKSFSFALDTIKLYRQLIKQKEFVLSKQLLKSATSIGANVQEAQAAQSKKDFISKMAISSKEARESLYWLCLLEASKIIAFDYNYLKAEITEIIKILTVIVKSSKLNNSIHHYENYPIHSH